VQLVAQHGEQAGFAGAVGADQADLVAWVQGQVGVFQQRLQAAHQADVGEADHFLGRFFKTCKPVSDPQGQTPIRGCRRPGV